MVLSFSVPSSVIVGQQLTVILTVNNNGTANLTNVVPGTINTSGTTAGLTPVSGPLPASDPSLLMTNTVQFTWIYTVTSAGTASFQDGVSSNEVTEPAASSTSVSCQTPTPTVTATYTVTRTYTPTYTRTVTPAAPTATLTLTPAVTASGTEQITDLVPYPNPFDPDTAAAESLALRVDFNITQTDNIDKIGVKIYTQSYRLIREVEYADAGSINTVLTDRSIPFAAKTLANLSNGTYYYYIYVDQNGTVVRSKIDKIIILR